MAVAIIPVVSSRVGGCRTKASVAFLYHCKSTTSSKCAKLLPPLRSRDAVAVSILQRTCVDHQLLKVGDIGQHLGDEEPYTLGTSARLGAGPETTSKLA